MRFRIFSRANQYGRRWYFHGRADGNHEIICRGEGYHNLDDCIATVNQIKAEAADAPIDLHA